MTPEELEKVAQLQRGYEERIERQKASINRLIGNVREAVGRYEEALELINDAKAILSRGGIEPDDPYTEDARKVQELVALFGMQEGNSSG